MKPIFTLSFFLILFCSSKVCAQKEMKEAENPKTYTTKKSSQKPVKRTFKGYQKKNAKVYISQEKFKSFPRKKQEAILEKPNKYIITKKK